MTPAHQMNPTDQILERLNPEQRQAVTTTDGPLLVIAGAGTGKTRVITHRIAYLILDRGVPPWKIFASTFTNKAAEEMRRRLEGLVQGYEAARISIGTFHSICVSILRREASHLGLAPRFTIADDSDQKALIKDVLKALDIPKSALTPEEALGRIGSAKIVMISPQQAREDFLYDWGEDAVRVYEEYEDRLAQSNAVDFDDLLLKVVRLFQENPDVLAQYQDRWEYFLIDEYQDINKVQFELVRLLASRDRNLCVVGDEDQSIYSWRGAEIDNILDFDKQFEDAGIIRLEQNYRSTETILSAANTVIAQNKNRIGKNLWSGRGGGDLITTIVGANEREEAALVVDAIRRLNRLEGVPYSHFAIFYRVNALSRIFEDYLRERGIPYRVIGGIRFYDRAEIKDLLAYLRVIVNPVDNISLMRILNKPRRGIGEKTQTKFISDCTRKRVPLYAHLKESVAAGELKGKLKAGVVALLSGIEKWRELAENHAPLEVLEAVLRDTRYESSLGPEGALETLTRQENVEELRHALRDYANDHPDGTIDDYLERVTLASAVDQMGDDDNAVSLMTLHSAKGLEFPVVFMTGLEDSIFPSPRSISESGQFEEERRLFYVGVTRAQDRLFMTRSDCRLFYGRTQYNPPSLFWHEVPEDLTQRLDDARMSWGQNLGKDAAPASGSSAANSSTARSDSAAASSAASRSAADSTGDSGSPRSPRLPDSLRRRPAAPAGTFADPAAGNPAVSDPADELASATDCPFPPGSRVRHPTLGEGEVTAIRGDGPRRKVTIKFDAGLNLEVMELYGGLQPVEDLPF